MNDMTSDLKIVARTGLGKKAVRRLRHEGFVPGVIYGDNTAPILVAVDEKNLSLSCYSSSFLGHVISTQVGEKQEQFLPKEVVFHPVTGKPLHVDFQRISKGAKVKVGIPIEFINEQKSPGIKKGGIINVVIHKLECYCSPVNIPEKIQIDISDKEIGDSISLSDICLPEGVVPVLTDRSAIIVTIVGARVGTDDADINQSGTSADGIATE